MSQSPSSFDRSRRESSVLKKDDSGNIKDLVHKLKYVFTFYASYGDRLNDKTLRSNKLMKMMKEAKVIDNHITPKRLDLLFCSHTRHSPVIRFHTFLDLLTKLAQEKYADDYGEPEVVESLRQLLANHFIPLYDSLRVRENLTSNLSKAAQIPIPNDVKQILHHIAPVLIEIFMVYFPWEPQTSDDYYVVEGRSKKAMLKFLQEFEACPSLLSIPNCFNLWSQIVETDDEQLINSQGECSLLPDYQDNFGTVFTLNKFFIFLCKVAYACYDVAMRHSVNASPVDRVIFLLDRMELSEGFLSLEKKTSRPHVARTSLIPPESVVFKVQGRSSVRVTVNDEHKILSRFAKSGYSTGTSSARSSPVPRKRNSSLENSSIFQFPSQSQSLIEYRPLLTNIFQAYCSFGEPMNLTKLKSSKFMKMLRDCGLLTKEHSPLSSIKVDLMFVKLTVGQVDRQRKLEYFQTKRSARINPRSSLSMQKKTVAPDSKMDFEQFLQAVEYMAEMVYGDEQDHDLSAKLLINDFLSKLDIRNKEERVLNSSQAKLLMSALSDDDMIELLSLVHKTMLPYFYFYADSLGLMNFESYLNFCRDFEIFPTVLPKSKLFQIFYTLANIFAASAPVDAQSSGSQSLSRSSLFNQTGPRACEQTETELIDQHLFVESLALCALSINFRQYRASGLEKVCHLMERLSQSDGSRKVQTARGLTRVNLGQEKDLLTLLRERYPHYFLPVKPKKANESFTDILRREEDSFFGSR